MVVHKFKVGDQVILGEHQGVRKNWSTDMNQFVSKIATIRESHGYDSSGPVYTVDLDGGAYVWREANMQPADYTPAATATTYGARCKRCGEYNEYAAKSESFVCYGCQH